MEHKISKQSIRAGVSIFNAGNKLDKDTIIVNQKNGQIKKYYSLKRCLSKEDALVLKEKNFILLSQNRSTTTKVRLKV